MYYFGPITYKNYKNVAKNEFFFIFLPLAMGEYG
jgi:hypothetical protein